MYHSVSDVATRLGIPREWILHQIAAGRLPKRSFGKFRVLSDDDIELIPALRASGRNLPAPTYTTEHEVGYSVELAAARAGVGAEFVRDLAETCKIDAQRFGKSFIIFPTAIAQIESAPQTTARREALTYRTNTGNPKAIPPLNARQKAVVSMALGGISFAEIARRLDPPVSRERPSKIFATIKQRVKVLLARGIKQPEEIARTLDIKVETADKLIALVNHAE